MQRELGIQPLLAPGAGGEGRRMERPLALLGVLLVAQTLHTVEHVAQWVQYHILGWPLKASSGIISPLNAEVVHFVWNMGVLIIVVYLLEAGVRNLWMWLLAAWAAAHSAEHIFLFANYVLEVWRLRVEGLPIGLAQGRPGFFGAGGALSGLASSDGAVAWFCSLAPGLVAAPRLDVHFWWNAGEVALLVPAAAVALRRFRAGRR